MRKNRRLLFVLSTVCGLITIFPCIDIIETSNEPVIKILLVGFGCALGVAAPLLLTALIPPSFPRLYKVCRLIALPILLCGALLSAMILMAEAHTMLLKHTVEITNPTDFIFWGVILFSYTVTVPILFCHCTKEDPTS
jgi:hypothetical protein